MVMTSDKINILLIEDNPGDTFLVRERLNNTKDLDITLFTAQTMAKGLKIISAENIHVILLDLNLPDSRGIETFQKISKFSMHVPVVILSILFDNQVIYQAMKEGAQEYLNKSELENEALIRAIRYAIWSHHPA